MKVEWLQNKALTFKNVVERISGGTRTQYGSASSKRPPARKVSDASLAKPTTTSAPTTKSKENPYAKSRVGKCYRCGELGDGSNECSKRRPVNMVDYEDEDEVLIETKPKDSDFFEGEAATCVIQQLLCNQKNLDTTQRHQIFYSRCSIKNKVCNLIIDNDSCKNSLYRIGRLFEVRDGTTPPSIHH